MCRYVDVYVCICCSNVFVFFTSNTHIAWDLELRCRCEHFQRIISEVLEPRKYSNRTGLCSKYIHWYIHTAQAYYLLLGDNYLYFGVTMTTMWHWFCRPLTQGSLTVLMSSPVKKVHNNTCSIDHWNPVPQEIIRCK